MLNFIPIVLRANPARRGVLFPGLLILISNGVMLLSSWAAVTLDDAVQQGQQETLKELLKSGIGGGLDLENTRSGAANGQVPNLDDFKTASSGLMESVKSAYARDDYESVVFLLRQLLVEMPGNAKVLVLLAASHAQLEEYEEGIYYAGLALEEYSKLPKAYAILGFCYEKLGRLDKSVEAYLKLIALDNEDPRHFVTLGKIYQELGEMDKAVKAFTLSAERSPEDPIAFYRAGVVCFNAGQYDEAIQWHKEALALDSSMSLAWEGMGATYQVLSNQVEAINAYENALSLNAKAYRTASNLGVLYYGRGDRGKGLNWVLSSLEKNIAYYGGWRNLLMMLEAEVKAEDPDFAVEFPKRDEDGSKHYKYALKAIKAEAFPEALVLMIQALRLDFPNPVYFNDAGAVLLAMENPKIAVPFFRAAVSLFPEFKMAEDNLWVSIKMGQNEFERQLSAVLVEVASSPEDSQLLLKAGNLYALNNQVDKAEEMLLKAVKADSKCVDCYVRLAQHFFETKNLQAAIMNMGKALRLDSSNPYWQFRMASLLLNQEGLGYSDVELALRLAREACENTKYLKVEPILVLAKASMAAQSYEDAKGFADQALTLAVKNKNAALMQQIKQFISKLELEK